MTNENPYQSPLTAAPRASGEGLVWWLLRGFAALFCVLLALAYAIFTLTLLGQVVFFPGGLTHTILLTLAGCLVGAISVGCFTSAGFWLTKRDGVALVLFLVGLLPLFLSPWLLFLL
jgi:hypothetical protein